MNFKTGCYLNGQQPGRFLYVFILLICLISSDIFSQNLINISGKAFDKDNAYLLLPKLMIINKRTGNGIFADAEGNFSINVLQSDTLILSAIGFNTKKICLRDSVIKKHYYIEVEMQKLQYTLKEISVFGTRSLSDIDKDIAKLDSTRRTRYFSEINGLESPITYLYERFSKFGKSKQKVAEWENEDLKKDVLKDLFRLYIKNEIIDLSEEEFDSFINFCNLSEEFIKTASQFELVVAIKGKFQAFEEGKDYYKPHEKRW
jgi:hypothetical protein